MDQLSVIICTYNPNPNCFKKCLEAIEMASAQSQPLEILIIDNNSKEPVREIDYVKTFLSQHSFAKVIDEQKQGLTPARLRGITESKGNTIVYIDDDNWIDPSFFSKGIEISSNYPHIGAWSGQVDLYFENEPEAWTKKYWGLLVYRRFDDNRWSNFPYFPETMPCGAGLFVRRNVADYYHELHKSGKRNIQLDRSGNSLFSGGDNDLAACACDIGLGVGLFYELKLDHFIPASRVTKEYLLKLAEGISASSIVFGAFRNNMPPNRTLKNKVADILRLILKEKTDKDFYKAVLRGQEKGRSMAQNVYTGTSEAK
jgi:glycosyltransferase involved in cell wall biosynthesis